MGVRVDENVSRRLVRLRRERRLTQLELKSRVTGVSLRTIQDLENHRRDVFSEETLLRICRALDISYDELWADPAGEEPRSRAGEGAATGAERAVGAVSERHEPRRRDADAEDNDRARRARAPSSATVRWIVILSLLTIATVIILSFLGPFSSQWQTNFGLDQDNPGRHDWVQNYPQLDVFPITVGDPDWIELTEGKPRYRIFNYAHYDRTPHVGDTIHFETQWSWYYRRPSIPEVFISAYAEWDPDREIRVFHGDLSGEGTKQAAFTIPAPGEPGIYRIRLFYAEAYAPITSFYGAPPPNQVTFPSASQYEELFVEVLR